MWKVNFEKKSGTSHWKISISYYYPGMLQHLVFSDVHFFILPLIAYEVKSKTKFQIFSSKREVVAYKSFQIFIVNWLANVWYFENWLLRRGGCKWRFDCIQINCLEFNSSNGSSLHKPCRAGPIGLPHLCHLFDMWNKTGTEIYSVTMA